MMSGTGIPEKDLKDLGLAKARLEYPGLTARIVDFTGKPIEWGFEQLPSEWNQKIGEVTHTIIYKSLEYVVLTLGEDSWWSGQRLHKVLVAITGAAGGWFGGISLPLELPVSTGLILRSIADIARSEGHDLSQIDTKLSCIEVLALGDWDEYATAKGGNYWVVRGALAKATSEAAAFIAEKGLVEEGSPALVRFITTVAARFSIRLTEGAAAKAIPVVGALAGAAINLLFIEHFQEMARGHFVVKRLEKQYGTQVVKEAYRHLKIVPEGEPFVPPTPTEATTAAQAPPKRKKPKARSEKTRTRTRGPKAQRVSREKAKPRTEKVRTPKRPVQKRKPNKRPRP